MYLFSEEMISNCYLLTFFLVLNLHSIHSYVVLPINILPKENYKSDYEANSPKDIMLKEFITSFYTEYEIGTEPQKIPMIIKQKINDYVVTSANPMTNPKRDYSEKVIYSLSENFLQKYKFFNESESSTVSLGTCKNRKPYDDDIEKPLAEQMCASTDTVLLYENVDLKEKVSEKEFHFDLVRNIEDNVPGIIGLALTDEYHQTSFLSVLKQKKLIENYNWFFDCEKWNSTSGKVVIGALPHEVYPDKYSIEDFYNDTIESSNNYFWEINFDSIFVKDKIFSSEIAGLDLESNLNIGSKEYKKYLESSIEELVTNEKCFKDSFKGYDEDNDFSTNYDFYYCKKDDDVKKQLSTFLTTISFQSKSSNFTFELTNEQLMKEDGDYIFINVVFSNHEDRWKLGKQIALKYTFVFNPQNKTVSFYKKSSKGGEGDKDKDQEPEGKTDGNSEDGEGGSSALVIILIIVLCIVVIAIVIFVVIFCKKKKENSSELKDSQYYDGKDSQIVP